MDDLDRHIEGFKKNNPKLAKDFDLGYEDFKIGAILRMAREESGMTQEQVARKLRTYKNNISRLENHTENVKLETLEKYAEALGKKVRITIY
jgi:HTH-type transcriptional regulator / antitoxin HipB